LAKYGTGDSRSFWAFPHESKFDKNTDTVPGQTVYADFEFAVFFLIGG